MEETRQSIIAPNENLSLETDIELERSSEGAWSDTDVPLDIDRQQLDSITQDLLSSSQTATGLSEETEDVIEKIISDSERKGYDAHAFLADLLDIDPNDIRSLNTQSKKDVITFIIAMLDEYIYPTEEVKAFAEFARNGGTLQQFIKAIEPIDFRQLSDEEVIFNYYHNRMEEGALADYIDTLKETGKLKKKADEIRKEVGVIQLSPDELVAKQREILAQQEVWKQRFRHQIERTIKELGFRFKNTEERDEFIDSLVESRHFYDDDNRLVYVGNTFSYILNSDVAALVIAAYSLFNYNTEQERRKSNQEIVENIKKNLIQSRNIGFAY
ncbi:MAG: hypothetical protein RML94_00160 [Bacteroidia bacterium]|nr:hypothetical protein [Bacteroidia bacterium]